MRNKKEKSKNAHAARRARWLMAYAESNMQRCASVLKKGWTSDAGKWVSPDGLTTTDSVIEACNQQRQTQRLKAKADEKAKIDYLVENGWRWSEVQKKWQRLHWEKVVEINESAYHNASLNKAYRLQKKLDLIPSLGRNWWHQ